MWGKGRIATFMYWEDCHIHITELFCSVLEGRNKRQNIPSQETMGSPSLDSFQKKLDFGILHRKFQLTCALNQMSCKVPLISKILGFCTRTEVNPTIYSANCIHRSFGRCLGQSQIPVSPQPAPSQMLACLPINETCTFPIPVSGALF